MGRRKERKESQAQIILTSRPEIAPDQPNRMDGAQKRIDDFFGQCRDYPGKCSSNDDGDGEIHYVATQNKVAESFEHE